MHTFVPLVLSVLSVLSSGSWLTSRHDPSNQARADVSGKMTTAPREVWRISTGGEVGFVRALRLSSGQAVGDKILAQVGTSLQLTSSTGKVIWADHKLGVGLVMHIADFDLDGRQEVLVRTDARTVVLLDVLTGGKLWSWQCDASTNILGSAFYKTPTGTRFITFPAYSMNGYCFDFSGNRQSPKLLWQKNYDGKYGAGYGPSIVLKDMDADGKTDIVLSGKVPSVYHAVLDIDTGEIKFDLHYDLDGWGRPYGLLKAIDLDRDGKPEIVMISCQVEEYLGVTRNVEGKGLEKIWAKFIEKDWPTDEKELRPQITSLADVTGSGKIELVVGVWEGRKWRTLVIDPLKDFTAQRGSLEGLYFWGNYDLTGDGIPEIIVSKETNRRPGRITTLQALDGKTLKPVAVLANASVFGSGDSPLPEDTAFIAIRNNPIYLKGGILVRKGTGTFLWSAKALRPIAGPGFVRADVNEGLLFLTDAKGVVQRFDESLKLLGKPLAMQGRTCQPLVWAVDGKRELVYNSAGGKVIGGVPNLKTGKLDGRWEVTGTMPALHLDAAGVGRLSVADMSNPDKPAAVIHERPNKSVRIPLDYPPYLGLTPFGKDFHLLVNLQTGVHTMALACFDATGQLLWQDKGQGAHPRVPGAASLDGEEMIVADDHGVLKVYDSMGNVIGNDPGWPPAYTIPILGPWGILRASGIRGTSLIDKTGHEKWKKESDIWRYYKSLGAVGDVYGDGRLMLGELAEDGMFECIDTADGHVLWSLKIGEPSDNSIAAGDLDGNGRDEFLVGMSDGRLLCIAKGKILWQKRFNAGVANPIIADVDGDSLAEIVLSTSDGYLRIMGN
jgi:outer membrane protein assembly factor BamB